MLLPLLLAAAQAAAPPGSDPRQWNDPPTAMVDFLGRRQLCKDLGEPEHYAAYERAEAARLRCAGLPAEERAWRARYASDAAVRAWLDLDPSRFQLNQVIINSWHGPPAARPRRIEQHGVDRAGQPYRLLIERNGAESGTTRITAALPGRAPRSFTLDNARVPLLDLQSLIVAFGPRGARGYQLYVKLRYGYSFGYCSLGEQDDRQEVSILFAGESIRASRSETINCVSNWAELQDGAARRGPGSRRR